MFSFLNSAHADVAQQALNNCANATKISSPSLNDFTKQGWAEVSDLPFEFRNIVIDGAMAAMSTDRNTPIDWAVAEQSARGLVDAVTRPQTGIPVRIFTHTNTGKAAVIVLMRHDISPDTIHCIYGGDQTPFAADLLNAISKSDELSGIRQATNGLQILTMRNRGTTETGLKQTYTIDTIFGRYENEKALTPYFNRQPYAMLGMSIIRTTN